MLEKLKLKRAALVAQREQCLANYNLTTGAIAIVDELLGELAAEAAAAEEAKAAELAGAADLAVDEPLPVAA